jgi:hypothetical protein
MGKVLDAAKQVDALKFFTDKGGADEVPVGEKEDQETAVALANGLAEMESEDDLGEEDEEDPMWRIRWRSVPRTDGDCLVYEGLIVFDRFALSHHLAAQCTRSCTPGGDQL